MRDAGYYWVTVLTTGDITVGHYDGGVWRIIGHEDTFDDHFIRAGRAIVRGK